MAGTAVILSLIFAWAVSPALGPHLHDRYGAALGGAVVLAAVVTVAAIECRWPD